MTLASPRLPIASRAALPYSVSRRSRSAVSLASAASETSRDPPVVETSNSSVAFPVRAAIRSVPCSATLANA